VRTCLSFDVETIECAMLGQGPMLVQPFGCQQICTSVLKIVQIVKIDRASAGMALHLGCVRPISTTKHIAFLHILDYKQYARYDINRHVTGWANKKRHILKSLVCGFERLQYHS
jgi:hypothetical protein